MNRFNGTAARQLDLLDNDTVPSSPADARRGDTPSHARMRLLRKDIYVELAKRRRRAQIAARHALDRG